jgi:pimeloyl-ACP methyl ester carboxylesterase
MPARLRLALPLMALLAAAMPAQATAETVSTPAFTAGALNGTLASGARWVAEVPVNWNGTLLLWSRGYSPRLGDPELAPAAWRQDLLAQGYGLTASDYGAAGWALAEAVPAQRASLAAFIAAYGKPKRTIAWGQSMGGLVSTALAEHAQPGIDGAIAMCPSIGGAVGMMNMALDGAFAFKVLAAPDAGLELTGVSDDMANGRRAAAAVDQALRSRTGRARLALAGVLGGIPGWTRRDRPKPAAGDLETQVEEIGDAFVMGTFLPRTDQEKRAGGAFSWNTGIDYTAQLARSGRRSFVAALYRRAGLNLRADLARLQRAPRLAATPGAVDYMMRHYTPNARPLVPLVSLQTIGDGMTSPSLQRAYADAAPPRMVSSLWLDAAGHCGMSKEAALGAIRHLERRLDTGAWPARPAGTIAHIAAPMLRPCVRGKRCK